MSTTAARTVAPTAARTAAPSERRGRRASTSRGDHEHAARPTRRGRGPGASGRALARCVPDPEAFAAAWGRAALHATAAELPRPFDDLLDLDAVDELLSRRGLRTPFLRMAKDGAVVPPSRFTRPGGVGAAIGDQVDEAAVARLFADGTTIVLQALHRIWPPVIEFAGRLRDDVGHPFRSTRT